MKLSTFITSIPEMSHVLVKHIISQYGTWADFKEAAGAIANHGANTGWHGYIYSIEMQDFFQHNGFNIRQFLARLADDIGYSSVGKMVKQYNCLCDYDLDVQEIIDIIYTDDNQEMRATVTDAICWHCLEHVAQAYIMQLED